MLAVADLEVIGLPLGLVVLRRLAFQRMEKLCGNALAKQGEAWVECSNGVTWKLNLTESTHRWIVYGDYQGSRMIGWARSWLQQGGLVVDAGANIGQMLVYYGPLRGVRSIALEPLPQAFEWLNDCLAAQQGWRVDSVNIGLGKERQRFGMQCDGSGSTTF